MSKSMKNKQSYLQNTFIVCLLATLCCVLWGSAFPCIKIGYQLFSIDNHDVAAQILFAGMRFTLAGFLAVLLGSILSRQMLLPRIRVFPKILKLCLLQTVLQYLFFYVGLANTSGVKASIIEAANVFIAILVSSLLFKQETLSSVLLKAYSQTENPVMLSGYQFICGGIIMTICGVVSGGHIAQTVSSGGWIMLCYLACVSAVAYSIWGILLKYNPVSKVSVFGFMNPVSGVILSALLLSESGQAFGLCAVIALLLVCTGIYIVNK